MNEDLQRVYCTEDDDGHWYVLPIALREEFHTMLAEIEELEYEDRENAYDAFNEKFCMYETGGDLNLVELYAKI